MKHIKNLFRFLRYDLVYVLRYNLIRGVKNLYIFYRAVWSFRDYDYSFTLKTMKVSLKQLRAGIKRGNEVEVSKEKKLKQIDRAIEIIDNIIDFNYVEMAEKEIGYELDLSSTDISYHNPENDKIFQLARTIEEREWKELWRIFKGQNYNELEKVLNFVPQKEKNKFTEKWFDGSGMNSWWS